MGDELNSGNNVGMNGSATTPGSTPGSQEINALLALFNAGQLNEAAVLANELTVRFPGHWLAWKMLGVVFSQMGRNAEALVPMQKTAALLPGDAEAHNNLGITLQSLGRLNEAEASYRMALQLNPVYAQACSNLGSTLQSLGRLEEAEACYRQALGIKPDYAKAYCNLGATLQELERLDEAEACLRQAIQLGPDYADAYYNLGITLQALGRTDEAEASYRQAIQLNPDFAEAHYNLGSLFQILGLLNEAEASYWQSIRIKPDYTDALNNLALLFNMQGQWTKAFNTARQSLSIKETVEAKSTFAACAKHVHFTQYDSDIRAAMARALTEPWIRPSELCPACIVLVRLNPDIGASVTRANNAWPQQLSLQELFGANGLSASTSDPLLCALLDATPICDIEMERFLSMARHVLLETAITNPDSTTALDFFGALSRQCFINEYVYPLTDTETAQASGLRDSLTAALQAGNPVPALWPVAIAAYFPLCSVPSAGRLLDRQWPEAVALVLKQQLREPTEEQELRATIPRLTRIDSEVSLQVQHQYEENPYPRWIKTPPAARTKPFTAHLRDKFPLFAFTPPAKKAHIDVLVAGCGTGQHPVSVAQHIQGVQILAIDLSMSSLSYAKRKTRELGLTSIEYGQADLLKLGTLGRSFDVIESVGVLHHLADPWAGWQALLSLLRPGGFMKLGFYSEAARRHIVRIRNLIAEQHYGSTAGEIRQFRQDLIGLSNTEDFGAITRSPDFFNISTCRDLLFHVQEHRMTLTGIDIFLRENKLAFLGFEIEAGILNTYKLRFPDDRTATDLSQWQNFENENPDTFSGMYQFWIQKPG